MSLFAAGADFWRWQPHPEVWVLVGGVTVLAVYALRVVGPKVVPAGTPVVSRQQIGWFGLGLVLLWLASDWPMHDVGEDYLFSVHMTQHMVLTYLVPPVLLLATPEWLARVVLGRGRVKRAFYFLAKPVAAALMFNGFLLLTHAPGVVNLSVDDALAHYLLHTVLVFTAFMLWMPVVGPLPDLRISYPGQMLYLFVTSIIPTVPAGWLTFAEGAIYSAYEVPDRMFGLTITEDQQMAGVIMKLVGGGFLWIIITLRFFQWAAKFTDSDKAVDQAGPPTDLTWADVEREFDRHPPAPEPSADPAANTRSSPPVDPGHQP
ncbi:MAG: cytochrome c oxidase assembly protein [Acidimicrobiales bacterium]|nr:cytochrome c oxidase assembly protein [Acidimicrobiales bacterium]